MSSVQSSEVQFYAKHMFIAGDKHHSDKERLASFQVIAQHPVEPAHEGIRNQILLDTLESLGTHYRDRDSLKDRFHQCCMRLYKLPPQELYKDFDNSFVVDAVVAKILNDGVQDQPQLASETSKAKRTTLQKLELIVQNMFLEQDGSNMKDEIRDLTAMVDEKRKEVSGLDQKVKDLTEQNKDLQARITTLTADLTKQMEENVTKEEEIKNLKAKLVEYQNRPQEAEILKELEKLKDKNTKNIEELNKKIHDITEEKDEEIQRLNDELANTQMPGAQPEDQRREYERQIAELNETIARLTAEKNSTAAQSEEQQKEYERQITELNETITRLTAEKDQAATQSEDQRREYERQIVELNETIARLTNEKAEEADRLQTEIDNLKLTHEAEIQTLKDEIETLKTNHQNREAELNEKITNLTNEVLRLNRNNSNLIDKIKKIEEELADYVKLLGREGENLTHEQRIELLSKRLENIKTNENYTCLPNFVRENPWAFLSATLILASWTTSLFSEYINLSAQAINYANEVNKSVATFNKVQNVQNLRAVITNVNKVKNILGVGENGKDLAQFILTSTLFLTFIGSLKDRADHNKRQQAKKI